MNILVAGYPRSGSTRLYNIIRLILLQKHSFDEMYCCWYDYFDEAKAKKINIVKLHYYEEKWLGWADLIFTTKRDLRYVAASCLEFNARRGRVYGDEVLLDFLNSVMAMYEGWGLHSTYQLVYENCEKNLLREIFNLSQILGIENTNCEQIMTDLAAIRKKSIDSDVPFDWNTLMNRHHVSDKNSLHYSQRLSANQTKLINDIYGGWLKENGYI